MSFYSTLSHTLAFGFDQLLGQSGKTAGTTDSYWYTPKTNKKLRSLKEVLRFVDFLQQVNADEALAWLKLKEKTK